MTPANMASCMTSTVLTDRPACRAGGLGMRRGAANEHRHSAEVARNGACDAARAIDRPPPCRGRAAIPESSRPPETACPALTRVFPRHVLVLSAA